AALLLSSFPTQHKLFWFLVAAAAAAGALSEIQQVSNNDDMNQSSNLLESPYNLSTTEKVWPALELNWRLVMATVIGFLGSACGTVGGVGGGGIFVPMLTLIVGFDTKSAAAISK
ncbi:hypothetical protein Gorai_023031, partial [Gossypium raimondii]|nr:hypothetical protein [Gossypium raimondii]